MMAFHAPKTGRIVSGEYASDESFGNNGAFWLNSLKLPNPILCIVSDQALEGEPIAWEHVSVSIPAKKRIPTWLEMCVVKAVFWDPEDCVVQYHPPESDYVNVHPHVLHLWRPVGLSIPRPPSIMVGYKS